MSEEQNVIRWLESFRSDMRDDMNGVKARLGTIESKLFTGNGDALVTQVRVLAQAVADCQNGISKRDNRAWGITKIIIASCIGGGISLAVAAIAGKV